MTQLKPSTISVRTSIESDTQYHAVVPPIYLSTNYGFPTFGHVPKFDYTRSGNPNRNALEEALSKLELGAGAVVTNCGTSAINLWVSRFSLMISAALLRASLRRARTSSSIICAVSGEYDFSGDNCPVIIEWLPSY